jgi:hypothetical protein
MNMEGSILNLDDEKMQPIQWTKQSTGSLWPLKQCYETKIRVQMWWMFFQRAKFSSKFGDFFKKKKKNIATKLVFPFNLLHQYRDFSYTLR